MAGHTTKPYKNTFSGSVGAGMGSLFSPNGRKYYILEHKVTSKYHRAGESQEIIVDNIELGRDSHCQVRFDESFKTVSRHHAGIVKDGDMWKLVQISKTNSTFLNGRPVKTEWYLQNGDEIQLSVNGPKLGFITPTGKKSTVGSIGLTRRLSLFRQQALRPYKTAIAVLSCILVLSVGGLGSWNYILNENLKSQSDQLAQQILDNKNNKDKLAKLKKDLADSNAKIADYEKDIEKAKEDVKNAKAAANRAVSIASTRPKITSNGTGGVAGDIEKCFPYVYFIQAVPYYNGQPLMKGCFIGTGFLLNNGYFVTAQHVVNLFSDVDLKKVGGDVVLDPSGKNTMLNAFWNTLDIQVKLICTSTSDSFTIEYSSQNNPFKMGTPKSQDGKFNDDEGRTWIYRYLNFGAGDWAYIKVNKSGGLAYDPSLSKSLKAQTPLNIIGFPNGFGAGKNISPLCSQAIAAQSGLNEDGCIITSNNNTDGGNSGGPVLVCIDGVYKIVGIHVGIYGGRDDTKGRVVPIGNAF